MRCCRAQARTCPVTGAATRARRAPCGSRPRRRAAPRPLPRARLWAPRHTLSCKVLYMTSRGAATTTPAATMRTLTPTLSAPAGVATSRFAPPSRPVRRRALHVALCGAVGTVGPCGRVSTPQYSQRATVLSTATGWRGSQRRTWRSLRGGVGPTGVRLVRCGTTYRVRMGYSRGTCEVLTGCFMGLARHSAHVFHAVWDADPSRSIGQCVAPPRALVCVG